MHSGSGAAISPLRLQTTTPDKMHQQEGPLTKDPSRQDTHHDLCCVAPTSLPLSLGSCGPGKLPEKGKFPKCLGEGAKGLLDPGSKRSLKSLLHHPKLPLHRCKMGFGWCKRLFGDLCSLGPKDLLHPPLSTFGNFPFSVNFPGPQLPNPFSENPGTESFRKEFAEELCGTEKIEDSGNPMSFSRKSISELCLICNSEFCTGKCPARKMETRDMLHRKCFPKPWFLIFCAGVLPARKIPKVSFAKYF